MTEQLMSTLYGEGKSVKAMKIENGMLKIGFSNRDIKFQNITYGNSRKNSRRWPN